MNSDREGIARQLRELAARAKAEGRLIDLEELLEIIPMDDDDAAALQNEVLQLEQLAGRYESALRRIAAPRRPDGTYNLGREACEQIAKKALSDGPTLTDRWSRDLTQGGAPME